MTDLTMSQPIGSPFDAIRYTRPDGSEFWSARDLMPLMGYSTWQHFEVPIRRAMQSADSQSMDLTSHFTASRKNSGGRPAEDFELSRLAAYLVAMNGDPNKPQVAAAQGYFAVRTRQAETAELDLSTPEGVLALAERGLNAARLYVEAKTAVNALADRLAEVGPAVHQHAAFLSSTGDLSVNETAKVLSRDHAILTGERRLWDWLLTNRWVYRDGLGKPRAYQARINQGALAEKAQWHYHPETGEPVMGAPHVRVTARGIDLLARAMTEPDAGPLELPA